MGYKEIFKSDYKNKYFSPGRINLIGEHIDYNGGNVFPMAISKGIFGYVGKNSNKKINLFSTNFSDQGIYEIEWETISDKSSKFGWTNLVRGVFKEIRKKYLKTLPFGLNIFIDGNIPASSGLSSSASLGVLIVKIFNDVYSLNIPQIDFPYIVKAAENNYLGAKTGIMDQFIITFGEKNKSILLNTNTMKYEYSPFDLDEQVTLLVVATNKTRELADSKYNERVDETNSALNKLKEHFDIKFLCDLKIENLPQVENILNDDLLFKRTKHCIEENDRTLRFFDHLKNNNMNSIGQLLYESHESLKNNYEVSCDELDFIYEFSKRNNCLGARMTGAGFGGSSIVLLKKEQVPHYIKQFEIEYTKKFNLKPTLFEVTSSDGVRKII